MHIRQLWAVAFAAAPSILGAQVQLKESPVDSAMLPKAADASGALSNELVAQAVQAGLAGKKVVGLVAGLGGDGWAVSMARSTTGYGFAVLIQGPYARIASEAAKRAQRYQTYTVDSVPAEIRAPVVLVAVSPITPRPASSGRAMEVTPPARHIVLIPKGAGASAAVQPTSVQTFPESWNNALGAQYSSEGAVALFDLAKIPSGDFEIVIVTTGKEFRYPVKAKDRWQIR